MEISFISTCFLFQATVEDPNTGEAVDFPCRRWFAKNEDDGQISRELIRADAKDGDLVVDKGQSYFLVDRNKCNRVI